MELRDLIHYANDSNLDFAVLNLDWYKAFDLVPVDFIFKVLHELGFGDVFVSWIRTLYTGIESALEINNILSEFFPINRSVRQGCPLSMSLFIIFQEPFYRAVVASRVVRPLRLPDSTEINILGYADDSSLLVLDDQSLIEIYKIIINFEKATGSKLNKTKTNIFGVGNWKNRDQWPLPWLQSEKDYLYTLGIYHNNEYNSSVEKNWNVIINKMKQHSNILLNRRLSLYQRVAYANSCMLSKMWYTAHIYPLTESYAKEINKIIFQYIWGGRYEPIRRSTVYRSKKEGGLGIVNSMCKSKSIMINTFLKSYTHEDYKNSLMYYYCYIRLNNILPSDYSIHNASPVTTPYYETVINAIQKILHLPLFPFIPNVKIYQNMLAKEPSLVETQYPTLNWKKIWDNFLSLYITTYDKEIIYKHLHVVLATNKKLYSMNLINSSVCDKCTSGREQTPLHMFYQCQTVNEVYMWLLRVLLYICNFKPTSNIRCLYLDNTYSNRQQKNMCNIFITAYILTIWKTRKENLRIAILKNIIINKCLNIIEIIKHMPNQSVERALGSNIQKLDTTVILGN